MSDKHLKEYRVRLSINDQIEAADIVNRCVELFQAIKDGILIGIVVSGGSKITFPVYGFNSSFKFERQAGHQAS